MLVLGCQNNQGQQEQKVIGQEICIEDDAGHSYCLSADSLPPMVSLAPNITELLFLIYPDSLIQGVSPACNYPPGAIEEKPVFQNYPINTEQLLAHEALYLVKPDLFPTKTLKRLEGLGIALFHMDFEGPHAIFRQVRKLGRLAQREKQAQHYIDSIQQQIDSLRAISQDQPERAVLYVIQKKPLIVMGRDNFFTQNLKLIHARNALPETIKQPYPQLSLEFLQNCPADVILGLSMEEFEQTYSAHLNLKQVPAYKNGAIYEVDADLQTRPGARLDQALRELMDNVHGKKPAN